MRKPKTQADSYIVHLKVKCPHLATPNPTPTPPHYPEGIYQSTNQLKKSRLTFCYIQANLLFKSFKWWTDGVTLPDSLRAKQKCYFYHYRPKN